MHADATTMTTTASDRSADASPPDSEGSRTASGPRVVVAARATKRTAASLVRFTPEEFRAVTERARECGLPPARYLREVALGAIPKARRSPANAELIRHLARIGTDLRQLITVSATHDALHDQSRSGDGLDRALSALLEAIRRVE